MALLSLNFLPPPTSLAFVPVQTHCAAAVSKSIRFTKCRPRCSLSDSRPPHSDEDPFQKEEFSADEEAVNSADSLPPNGSVSSSSLTSESLAAQVEKDRQEEQLRETLTGLSQSLELLNSTLSEVSAAVRVLSARLGIESQTEGDISSIELRGPREADAREGSSSVFGALATPQTIGGAEDGESRSMEDVVPPHLVEQNIRAHKLAYRLQQAFVQARIQGLGNPFQVAADEFAGVCMEAHALGIGLKELQLQLVLQDGSLSEVFAIRNQRWSTDPIMNEESRIRSLWVRLVYSTLAQLEPEENENEERDPTDSFVKEVITLALKEGFDLERLKLEQSFAGPDPVSGAVKAMRENHYLILLTMERARASKK